MSKKGRSGRWEDGFPPGGSGVDALMRAFDRSTTTLGPISEWPAHLKSVVRFMLPAKAQIVLFWGPEFIALYNDAYAPTIGQKHPRALGRPARENWAELWDDLEPLLRRVLETGETVFAKDRPFYIERHGYPEDVYFDISYSPVHDEAGEIGGVLCIVSETTERVVAQRELAKTQKRLSQALSASGMIGTFDWHVQTDTFYSDARFAEMFSVDPAKSEKGAPLAEYLAGIHPEDVERITEAVNHALASVEKYIEEYRLLQKDGTIRWVETRGECLRDDNGNPSHFVGVVVDITNQKEAQERQRLLAREANHRVKNLFAVFHGIISLSARSARTPKEMAQSLRGRLDALMRAKDLIRPGIMGTEHESERTTMDALVRTVLMPHDDGTSRIVMGGPDVTVGARAVTSLALALHESATNATKYGALSEPNGAIRIKWEARDGDFHLEWEETGGPQIVAPPQAEGFGSILTQRSITDQLGGKIEYDWQRNGLKLRVTVPLDRLGV
ncbi:PAS domain-containing protein [Bradyrhizobium jicamae]|nr:PAS domain-containing protein [Bradyrhizobium jicamae]